MLQSTKNSLSWTYSVFIFLFFCNTWFFQFIYLLLSMCWIFIAATLTSDSSSNGSLQWLLLVAEPGLSHRDPLASLPRMQGSSQTRDRTYVPCALAGAFLTTDHQGSLSIFIWLVLANSHPHIWSLYPKWVKLLWLLNTISQVCSGLCT